MGEVLQETLQTKVSHCLGVWDTLWDAGEEHFLACTRFVLLCLGEEAPKARKGRERGGVGGKKCGKIEVQGDRKVWSHAHSLLVRPYSAPNQHSLVCPLINLIF